MFNQESIGLAHDKALHGTLPIPPHCNDRQWFARTHAALQENRLRLYFQRIAPLHQREYCERFEVLLRMQDSDGRLIAPGAFIPAAEVHGLMPQLDRWVIANSFALLATQPQRDYRCSINLSAASLNDERMLPFIQRQLQRNPIDPQRICFEVTETAAVEKFVVAIQLFNELKQLGCRFTLDDFGSGLSSFGYLRSLPVDYLKIDGHFIHQLTDHSSDYALVDAINRISHLMNIKTVAELVERPESITVLRRIGVDYAQGYWVHRPQAWTPATEIVAETLYE